MAHQLGVVLRGAQAAGEGDASGQRVLHFLRHAKQHGGAEDAGRNGHVADAVAGEVTGNRQGHAHHAALGGCISGLADLAVIGSHAGRGDQHATLAGGFGLVLAHGLSGQADHVEAADQVDRDGLAEQGQRMRAVLAHGLLGGGDAGAVHQAHQLAQRHGLGHHGLAVGLVAHIALHERAADFLGHSLAFFGLHVGNDHGAALGGQHACRAFAQARCAAGDDEYLALDVHGCLQ